MNTSGIRQLIYFIEHTCKTTLTPKQSEQLREIKFTKAYDIVSVRKLYRISIDNRIYPECPYCKNSITCQEDFTIDHIVPKSKGGKDNIENLQPMHKSCNSDKGCEMPEVITCAEVPVKKHRKNHHGRKNKERGIVKSRTPEELYQKCKRIDQARASKANSHNR